MVITNKEQLVERVLKAIRNSGWQITKPSTFTHPLEVTIYQLDKARRLLIYIWNVTHGGKSRNEREYRIQITGVDSLEIRENTQTLLMGRYEIDGEEVFVAFDPSRHQTFGHSPSLQIRINTIMDALENGISLQEKSRNDEGNIDEVAVAIRPDCIISYITDIHPNYYGDTIKPEEIAVIG